jgi:hypothetical protein
VQFKAMTNQYWFLVLVLTVYLVNRQYFPWRRGYTISIIKSIKWLWHENFKTFFPFRGIFLASWGISKKPGFYIMNLLN